MSLNELINRAAEMGVSADQYAGMLLDEDEDKAKRRAIHREFTNGLLSETSTLKKEVGLLKFYKVAFDNMADLAALVAREMEGRETALRARGRALVHEVEFERKGRRQALRALALTYDAMNYMGDILNGHDMVEPEDEAATCEAFVTARAVLGVDRESDAAFIERAEQEEGFYGQ